MGYGGWGRWKPYVPVARRRAAARRTMSALQKKGVDIQPIEIEGRAIARTFWGKAWCEQMESFGDYENRLPRGRTYVRNGSVCHLAIKKGHVEAKVSGSEIYNIRVEIETLSTRKWRAIKKRCAGQIGSLLELLRGDLSDQIMEVVTDHKTGLFPRSREITFKCDCPDWARMCKHVAAVLYGIGARLDQDPGLLFRLRGVNHEALIEVDPGLATSGTKAGGTRRLATSDLGDVFGIELEQEVDAGVATSSGKARSSRKKATAKKVAKKSVGAEPTATARGKRKRVAKKKAAATTESKGERKKEAKTGKQTTGGVTKKPAKKRAAKKKATTKKAARKKATRAK